MGAVGCDGSREGRKGIWVPWVICIEVIGGSNSWAQVPPTVMFAAWTRPVEEVAVMVAVRRNRATPEFGATRLSVAGLGPPWTGSLEGLKLPVTPGGRPLMVRKTVPTNP